MSKRHGFTLVELLVALSVLAIILPMAGGTVFFLLRAQSQSAESLRDALALTQLSHTFRSDVHAARRAQTATASDGMTLDLDESRTIDYRAEPNGFVSRTVRRGKTVERHEQFRVGDARVRFALDDHGREPAVTVSPRPKGSSTSPGEAASSGIRIAAVCGRNSSLAAPRETPARPPASRKTTSLPKAQKTP